MSRNAFFACIAATTLSLVACGDGGSSNASSSASSSSSSGGLGGQGGSAGEGGSAGQGGLGGEGGAGGFGGEGGAGGFGGEGGAGGFGGEGGLGGSGGFGGGEGGAGGFGGEGGSAGAGGLGGAGGSGGGPPLNCGNGVIDADETCDDGNNLPGDGCSPNCLLEPGTPCGNAVDLAAMGTKQGSVLVYSGTTAGSPVIGFGAPSCSSPAAVPSVVHRYRTGSEPARVTVESTDVGGPLKDSVLWAYLDCLNTQDEHACDDDSGDGPLALLKTGVLPPHTNVFVVLSGYGATDIGPYQLRVLEEPFVVAESSGTCAMPTMISGSGSFAGATLATDPGALSASCTGNGPEAVYALTLASTSDLTVRVDPGSPLFDMGVYLLQGCETNPTEIACADLQVNGFSESFSVKDLPAGTYHVVVDGFSGMDLGAYVLAIDIRSIVGIGLACDPSGSTNRCVQGAACVDLGMGPRCASVTTLLSQDFSQSLVPFTVLDALGDGKSFYRCDPEAGCPQNNTTGSASGGPYALIKDEDNVSLDGEILASPPLDASALSQVFLEFDHDFDSWPDATDLARVEVSVMGGPFIPVATYTQDAKGRVRLDISALVAGKPFAFRFFYDDQTAGGDPFAEEWRIDDVLVYGL